MYQFRYQFFLSSSSSRGIFVSCYECSNFFNLNAFVDSLIKLARITKEPNFEFQSIVPLYVAWELFSLSNVSETVCRAPTLHYS